MGKELCQIDENLLSEGALNQKKKNTSKIISKEGSDAVEKIKGGKKTQAENAHGGNKKQAEKGTG